MEAYAIRDFVEILQIVGVSTEQLKQAIETFAIDQYKPEAVNDFIKIAESKLTFQS